MTDERAQALGQAYGNTQGKGWCLRSLEGGWIAIKDEGGQVLFKLGYAWDPNALFVVLAYKDVPALLDERHRLKAENAELKAKLWDYMRAQAKR